MVEKPINIIILIFSIALLFNISGCQSKNTSSFNINSITSYRDIPGITEKEISAIETLKSQRQGFSYAMLHSTEAFTLPDGAFAGFSALFCEFLSELFDIPFVLVLMEWDTLLDGITNKTFDFTGELTPTAERQLVFHMTNPIVERGMIAAIHKDSHIIENDAELNGKKIGFFEGTITAESIIDIYPDIKFEVVNIQNYDEMLEKLRNGTMYAFIEDGAASIYYKEYDDIITKAVFPSVYTPVSLTTANPNLEPVISVVNKYLACGGFEKLYELFMEGDSQYSRYIFEESLDTNERAFISGLRASGNKIPILLESDNYPFSFYNNKEKSFQGIAFDILAEINKLTGIEFEVINDKKTSWSEILESLRTGKAALVSQLIFSEERADNFIWPEHPYFTSRYVFISKSDLPDKKMHQIERAKVGINKDTVYEELYKKWFLNDSNVIYYSSASETFEALEKGKIDLMLSGETFLLAITNYLEKPGYKANHVIPSSLEESYFGLNKKETALCSIITKAMSCVDTEDIGDNWTSRVFDYSRQLANFRATYMAASAIVLLFTLIILSIALHKNTKKRKIISQQALLLENDIAERKNYIEMVEALNKSLEIFVSFRDESFDNILPKGIKPIADALRIDRICVYRNIITEKGKRPTLTYFWDRSYSGTEPIDDNILYLPDTQFIRVWTEVLLMDEVINKRICDMQKEEAEYLSIFSIKAICMVPIFSHGDFWGAVVLIDRTTNEYFEDGSAEANILQVAARIIAKAIIRAEAEEYTRLMLDTGPLCCQLWDRDFKIIDCNEAAVKLYGYKSKKEYIERWTFECSPLNQPDGQKSVNKAIALIDKVFTTGETAVFEWMQQMPDGTPFPAEITLSRVRYKDDYIVAGYTRDLRELKTLKEKAEEIYYDALTGLYNRRYLDKELNNLIKSISRSRGTLSIMMIDIDRFKQYNDTYGHSEGDKCLKLVAEVLSKSMTRKADFVVRYGGEEFLIALPNTDVNGAHIMAEKLLDNMRKAQIPHKDSDVADHVTISIGVTTGNVTYTQNESDYIKKADEMLYISKQGGRDRYTYQGL